MKNSIIEIWQPVPGYEGLYEASNLGRIRSLWFGKVKVLKPKHNGTGYYGVHLSKDGKKKKFYIHRLVWISFRGPIPKGIQINHLNEDKSDNRLENLEMVTPKENTNYGTHNERVAKALKGKAPWNKGKKLSEEYKAKLSNAHKGKPHTAEHKAKISKSLKARHKREKSLGIKHS